jgi:antitoxin component YwqK of YwqJK toxin-antitoxin module
MKYLILALATFYAASLWGQKAEKTFWPGTNLKSEGAYNSERSKTGKWKFYYINGQVEAEGSYAGKRIDKTIEVIKRGKFTAIDDSYDTRDGAWTFYHENGKIKGKAVYKQGCPQGKVERWHENGQKAEETQYIDCKPLGSRKMWDKEGNLYFENQLLSDGKSIEIEWFSNNTKKSEIPYKDGQQFGKVRRWFPNGQKEEEVMMRNTRVHGLYRSWYENGNKKMEFFSINNVMSDEYREWNEQGKLTTEIIELKEQKHITVKQFWDNGQLKMQGLSKLPSSLSIHNWSQTRFGQWTFWMRDGSVLKTENYDGGRLVSTEMAD